MKKGTRVRIRPASRYFFTPSLANPIDVGGTVSKSDGGSISVVWDNGYSNIYYSGDLSEEDTSVKLTIYNPLEVSLNYEIY